jgi:hypothetical protein
MTVGAWVKLDGFRQGAGSTRLGIGYDLLAGLTEAELKAVLAHEVAHAHLVRRGLKRWLNHAVFRAVRLATGLVAHVHPARQAGTERDFGESFLAPADWFARKCARRVAACSLVPPQHGLQSTNLRGLPLLRQGSHGGTGLLGWRRDRAFASGW